MSFDPKSAMSNMKHESVISSILDPCVASFEHCSLQRNPSGRDRLRHQAFPGRIWFIANLPAAHALCAEFRQRSYRCRAGFGGAS